MNKQITLLFLLLLSLGMSSCTESVSDEIANQANSESGSGSGTVLGDDLSFRVVSKMDSNLSYVLHKSGSVDEACELTAPTGGFLASDYTKADTTRAIDCMFDAEELDIFTMGAEFEVQVDNNTCEYVEYRPYRFLQYQPGRSNGRIYKVACDAACTTANPNICDRYYTDYDGSGTYTDGVSFTNETTSEQSCVFDYSDDDGPNCDIGTNTIQVYEVQGVIQGSCSDGVSTNEPDCTAASETWTETAFCGLNGGDPDGTIVRDLDSDTSTDCGGDGLKCVNGPAVEFFGNSYDVYEATEVVEEAYRKSYSVSSPISLDYFTNKYVANFSRICADTTTDKSLASTFDTLTFKGNEVEEIAPFAAYSEVGVDANADGWDEYYIKADHPFNGNPYQYINPYARLTTKPYYAFYCLDEARDVVAQIRLFIREWDRQFEASDVYLARVSDYANFGGGTSRMDNSGFQDGDQPWNDFRDWDDFFETTPVFVNNQCDTLTNTPAAAPTASKNNFPQGSL